MTIYVLYLHTQLNKKTMTTEIGNIYKLTIGSHDFVFNVTAISNRFSGTLFQVRVIQTVNFTEEECEKIGCNKKTVLKWMFTPNFQTTEHGAINFAGQKIIKNWINLK